MKRERDPTPEEFEKLLAWLDPDQDEAGKNLTLIQARLIRILVSRGCIDAEGLADEVLNRVSVRIDNVKIKYGGPLPCFLGFADNVYREYLREQRTIKVVQQPPPPRSSEQLENEDVCLEQCLVRLPEADRDVLVRYFQGSGRPRIEARKAFCLERQITANALRIRAHYLRKKSRKCMEECLDEK